jgi:hypothetical protein
MNPEAVSLDVMEVPVRHAQSAPSTARPAWSRVAFAILLSIVLVLGLALVTAGLTRAGIAG